MWLSRGGNYPLTFDIQSSFMSSASDEKTKTRQFSWTPHCARWQDVNLSGQTSALGRLGMNHEPFLRLTRFALAPIFTGMRMEELIVTRDAPLLPSVNLSGFPLGRIAFPSERLTTLNFRCGNVAEVIRVLQGCPALVDLVCIFENQGGLIPGPKPLTLHFLRVLYCFAPSLLPYLTLPRLQVLELSKILEDTGASVNSLVSRSSCREDQLELRVCMHSMTTTQVRHFLRGIPFVSKFRLLIFLALDEDHIRVLADDEVLPRLRELSVYDQHGADPFDPMLDMLRYRAGRGLRSFELCGVSGSRLLAGRYKCCLELPVSSFVSRSPIIKKVRLSAFAAIAAASLVVAHPGLPTPSPIALKARALHERAVAARRAATAERLRKECGIASKPCDSKGVAQFDTIFPDYDGLTTHEHGVAHVNASAAANGTMIDGQVAHIGQFFFDETLRNAVEAIDLYNTNTNAVTVNDDDMWAPTQADNNYDSFPEFIYFNNEDITDEFPSNR
ncbi:hypothetical protein DFH07DRAFT_944566 [Mycena maculata]|uniref:FBD domain-containing protein n=1 Tax=Mycena maculata TaxID=230809 RepID=A0AAD7MW57_9AGAR|nr:hypothetical protein DFH07DRAFT_944566 [Mycena maculata]